MESQPQNPELRINPEIFHPCKCSKFWNTFCLSKWPRQIGQTASDFPYLLFCQVFCEFQS